MNKCFVEVKTKFLAWLTIVALVVLSTPKTSFSQDVKRGWAGMDATQANAVNARWSYNWGFVPPTGLHGEYVPMFWGPFNVQQRIDAILTYPNVQYVLGFNEPERTDQANMSVATAIAFWTDICEGLDGTGIKLVSPAVSDTVDGRAWLADFMQQAEANNLTVDEVAFHWYGFVNPANPVASANSFLNKVDQYHNDYGRNVWVTEFAGVDFAGQFTDEQMQEANATFMSVAIPGLESRSYVTRYSMWAFNDDCRPIVEADCDQWRPTIVGENYFKVHESGEVVELDSNSIGTDTAFLRGGRIENNGPTIEGGIKDIYSMTNVDGSLIASSLGGSTDWSVSENATISIEENSTLRKIDLNQIAWPNATICNYGLIRLFETGAGTLWIHGPDTVGIGTGQIRLDNTNTLRLGKMEDEDGFTLPFDIQCRGGDIDLTGHDIRLAGQQTIFVQTRFNVEGSLFVDGTLSANSTGGGSGIVKNGPGIMTLTGENTYVGNTFVNDGELKINGSIASGLNVASPATASGAGTVGGNATISGTLSPGNNVGIFQTGDCNFMPGSTLELDLGPFGVSDRLVTNGNLDLAENVTLRLRLTENFLPSVGDTFDILDAQSLSGAFTQFELPELQDGEWSFDLFDLLGIVRVVDSVVLGDVNQDGQVNLLDVAPFVQLLTAGTFQAEADMNGDSSVNLLDVAPFVELLSN